MKSNLRTVPPGAFPGAKDIQVLTDGLIMADPLVSILIITWNRRAEILETINSINNQKYKKYEIILVDNGSIDGTVEAVRKSFPDVNIVPLDSNLGVAARNRGIIVAHGEIIFCLDSDAAPGPESITNLVAKFQSDPLLGVINSKIVNAFTKQIDQVAGWSYSEKDKEDQNKEFLSFSFSEGGAAIRKELFDKVGYFWEPLFFGCEGFEFSLRVLDAGYKILYFPGSIVYHRAVNQSRISGGDRDSLFFRNFLCIYLVRFPWWLIVIFMPLKICASLIRGARRGYLRQMLGGLYEFVKQIPFLIQERKPIRNKTARHYFELQRQHGSLKWDLVNWLKYKA